MAFLKQAAWVHNRDIWALSACYRCFMTALERKKKFTLSLPARPLFMLQTEFCSVGEYASCEAVHTVLTWSLQVRYLGHLTRKVDSWKSSWNVLSGNFIGSPSACLRSLAVHLKPVSASTLSPFSHAEKSSACRPVLLRSLWRCSMFCIFILEWESGAVFFHQSLEREGRVG